MRASEELPRVEVVERWLDRLYVAAEGASLRREERRKAAQVTALLAEMAGPLRSAARRGSVTLVDAAAGKSYLGLLAAALLLGRGGGPARVVTIERDPARARAAAVAAELVRDQSGISEHLTIECLAGDVGDPALWPAAPALVVALHACGAAADTIIDATIRTAARRLLLVPCCTARALAASRQAVTWAARLGVPRHAAVRGRFAQSIVDAERTLRLEAAGLETEVVEAFPPTLSPHNLLWRARRVLEPGRMRSSRAALDQLMCPP